MFVMEFFGVSGGSGGKKVMGVFKKVVKVVEKFEECK